MSGSKPGIIKVLGMAVSLPAAILGSYIIQDALVKENIIKTWMGTALIVTAAVFVLILLIRYAIKQ